MAPPPLSFNGFCPGSPANFVIEVFGTGVSASGIDSLSVRCNRSEVVRVFEGVSSRNAANFSLGVCRTGFHNWLVFSTASGVTGVGVCGCGACKEFGGTSGKRADYSCSGQPFTGMVWTPTDDNSMATLQVSCLSDVA